MSLSRTMAWTGAVAVLVMLSGAIALVLAAQGSADGFDVVWPVPFAAMALIGAFVGGRRPENATGWLFLGGGTLMVANALVQMYAAYSYEGHSVLPGASMAAWLALWTWMPAEGAIALVLMVFPTGRPLGSLWGWVVRATVALIALTPITALPLLSVPGRTLFEATNATDVAGGRWLGLLGNGPLPMLLVVGFVALVARFVRSRGTERQQMKWFVLGTSVLAFAAVVPFFIASEDPISTPLGRGSILVGMIAVPSTAGIAILRYRLYDIDRIISRTVSYALVTGVLVGLYFGLVVLFQRASRPLTGSSDLAVAGSTLLVAAAFVPVRRRVQGAIDRRFDRARYNAARTIEAFSARLRDEVDIDALGADLSGVVRETMHPAHVSLWMREPR